jgi:hypothetical protein
MEIRAFPLCLFAPFWPRFLLTPNRQLREIGAVAALAGSVPAIEITDGQSSLRGAAAEIVHLPITP